MKENCDNPLYALKFDRIKNSLENTITFFVEKS